MSIQNESYQIASPNIVHETIDGETIILHLEKGYYYSLRKTAACIWNYLMNGCTSTDIWETISRLYDTSNGANARESVYGLIEQLKSEGLIVSITDSISSAASTVMTISGEKIPFEIPLLEKFTDMEELLLNDPIHDVDERGWPNVKK